MTDVVPVRVIRFDELEVSDPTSGMVRERAFELPSLWSGRVTTQPGAVSGWHHHDRNESSLYIVRGVLRLEFEGFEGSSTHTRATSCTCRRSPCTASRTRSTNRASR